MKILVAVDQKKYSTHAVKEVAKLAANTWANVNLLAVQLKNIGRGKAATAKGTLDAADNPTVETLFQHRKAFLSSFDLQECPYAKTDGCDELAEVKKGVYEAVHLSKQTRKTLTIRLRTGNPGKEILSEAGEMESDLIVLGCDPANECGWESGVSTPRKVANDAHCSVLIAKAQKKVKRIVCCLDHDRVSQASLEMINQMVTLHGAQLTIVGLSETDTLRSELERKLDNILRYYQERDIEPWIELVDLASLDAFIAQEARWGLMALWMGKQSILEKALPKSKVNKLIKASEASVLILR